MLSSYRVYTIEFCSGRYPCCRGIKLVQKVLCRILWVRYLVIVIALPYYFTITIENSGKCDFVNKVMSAYFTKLPTGFFKRGIFGIDIIILDVPNGYHCKNRYNTIFENISGHQETSLCCVCIYITVLQRLIWYNLDYCNLNCTFDVAQTRCTAKR